eukprot:158645-Chlamydomonas_euryale.AAC.2
MVPARALLHRWRKLCQLRLTQALSTEAGASACTSRTDGGHKAAVASERVARRAAPSGCCTASA